MSIAARREITKKYAREYGRADQTEKNRPLDALGEATGWNRDYARQAIRTTTARKSTTREQQRKPRPRKYSYNALVVLHKVWALSGQPSRKYLTAVMDDTPERLTPLQRARSHPQPHLRHGTGRVTVNARGDNRPVSQTPP